MELKNFFIQDDTGVVLPGAICYLYQRGTENLAAGLTGASGSALANPFTSGADGLVQLAAPNGLYDLRALTTSRDYRLPIQFNDVNDTMSVATAAAARAEQARDVAQAWAGIFPTTAEGLQKTAANGYFSVPSQESLEYLILYQNLVGLALEIKRYPSSQAISELDSKVHRHVDRVAGSDDLVLDSQSGQQVSSLKPGATDAAVMLVGTDEKLTIDTLRNIWKLGFTFSRKEDVLDVPEGHSDRRKYPELQTLPDDENALVLGTQDGSVALKIDTVNRRITSEFSFESTMEQRPPTVFVDVPPRIERNINNPLYRLANRVYQATATIARSGKTRYWTAWRADNVNAGEVPGNFTVMAYSDDNCQTVKEYGYLTYSPAGPDKHMVDPMLWLDPAGRLWLFFGCMGNNKGFDGVQGTWAIICQNPNAEFPVWGQAFRLSHFGDPRRPIEVNGQWYIALDGWRHSADFPPRYMERVGPHIYRIDWQRQKLELISRLPPNNSGQYSGFFETEFMQRSDGSVLALCRSLSKEVETKFSVSTDLMKTWSAWQDYMPISPGSSSRMWLGRSPSGRTVFCWNNDLERKTLTLGISDDDGATYPYKVVLEPDATGQVTYPIVEFGDNGEIYIIYDNERTSGKRQIRIAKVIEQEVVARTSTPVVKIVSNPANV